MNEHLPEPLIYMAWMRALQDRLIRDELGPLAGAFSHVNPVFIERVFRDVDGASRSSRRRATPSSRTLAGRREGSSARARKTARSSSSATFATPAPT